MQDSTTKPDARDTREVSATQRIVIRRLDRVETTLNCAAH
jgi:hypothetical protein